MQKVSNEYLEAVNHYIRDIETRVYFNGSATPLVEEIISASVNEIVQSEDALTIGDFCTNMGTVQFTMPSNHIPLENGYFRLEHGIKVNDEYVYVNMGTFYIFEIKDIDGSNKYTVKGYDISTRFTDTYVPSVELPTSVEGIVRDICTQCRVTVDSNFDFPYIPVYQLYEASMKDTLKYMGGLMGKNVKVTRDNKLTFFWYSPAYADTDKTSVLDLAKLGEMELGTESEIYTITREVQFMRGFTKTTEEDITINSLTSGSENNVLVSGSGRGIKFDNPYMTQEILDNIMEMVRGFTYTPATISYRGNPSIEAGDIVLVEDSNGTFKRCIVSEQELSLTGMKGNITSKGATETETVMKQHSPTDVKLKKMYSTLTQAFKDSTELIMGAKGGYFVIDHDEEGHPTSWKIMDTPILTDTTKMWLFNKNGLAFSEDGGKNASNIAIDMNGNISANFITTGLLRGKSIELDLENGTFVLGLRGEDGKFEKEYLKIDQEGYVGGVKITEGGLSSEYIYDDTEYEVFGEMKKPTKGYEITNKGEIKLYDLYSGRNSNLSLGASGIRFESENTFSGGLPLRFAVTPSGIFAGAFDTSNISLSHDGYNLSLKSSGEFNIEAQNLTINNTVEISSPSYPALQVTRLDATGGAIIGFNNANGFLGGLGMMNTPDGGLRRWKSDFSKTYRVIDGSFSYKQTTKEVKIDMTEYIKGNIHAILIFARSWVSSANSGGAYILHGMNTNTNQEVLQLAKGSYAPTVSISGSTLTISYYDTNGGGYCIYPLM